MHSCVVKQRTVAVKVIHKNIRRFITVSTNVTTLFTAWRSIKVHIYACNFCTCSITRQSIGCILRRKVSSISIKTGCLWPTSGSVSKLVQFLFWGNFEVSLYHDFRRKRQFLQNDELHALNCHYIASINCNENNCRPTDYLAVVNGVQYAFYMGMQLRSENEITQALYYGPRILAVSFRQIRYGEKLDRAHDRTIHIRRILLCHSRSVRWYGMRLDFTGLLIPDVHGSVRRAALAAGWPVL